MSAPTPEERGEAARWLGGAEDELVPTGLRDSVNDTGLEALNPWVADGRYPEDAVDVPAGDVRRIVETAERVVAVVRGAFPAGTAGEEHGEEE